MLCILFEKFCSKICGSFRACFSIFGGFLKKQLLREVVVGPKVG
jgi:hypothetical protein